MTREQRKQAYEILGKFQDAEAVYINPKGEFFTEKYLGDNSLKAGEKLEVVKRKSVSPTQKQAEKEAEEKTQKEAEQRALEDAEKEAQKEAEQRALEDAEKEAEEKAQKEADNKDSTKAN
ncbi:hypothetical protein [Tenacibaculum finnmarkense]|uniref:hypothetical protein n=1 Tax=Tenacibaculum finnmarkense TaxID=2781243 RepID=UPI00187B9495|nr:hypothetical protein [Tenacibaculum finnmarkense]MBE7661076.1 hypothetical protein [Tenacibaculum finnmarkense genomovar finnmarkense]MCG8253255.1 hypothetical protein [Tenacibaculum finnmarkense genomovar finnmarkense]MCG8816729.1 hypothetical protein [Tenacibaculum finnmarkense]MCG8821560.1 hypothetical protein [Tenacibaculum finnmarkense]